MATNNLIFVEGKQKFLSLKCFKLEQCLGKIVIGLVRSPGLFPCSRGKAANNFIFYHLMLELLCQSLACLEYHPCFKNVEKHERLWERTV